MRESTLSWTAPPILQALVFLIPDDLQTKPSPLLALIRLLAVNLPSEARGLV